MHLDSIEEALSSVTVEDPPLFVQYNAKLFNSWIRWAIRYKEPEGGAIRPMGEKIGPVWLRFNFTSIDDFSDYYIHLIEQEL